MVSRLRCHDRPEIPTEELSKWKNRLCNEHFRGSTQIKLDDLAKVFRKMCEKEPTEKEKKRKKKADPLAKKGQMKDRVNVAFVYFLEGVLLSADAKKNCLDIYMSMVDHLDVFNSYQWGVEVFETTFGSMMSKNLVSKYQERLKKPTDKQLPSVKETYTLLGFPFAFQVSNSR